jgi:glycosyltransferase involved in cell wall biosynthesis
LNKYPEAVLILVGEDMMNLDRMIRDLGLTQSVIQTGYVSHSQAQQYLDISDFCINLRYPTAGETSRSVLQIMASQKPVIISDVGWFAELPDDACLKVDVNEYEEETLLQYMLALSSNPELKKTIGKNAQDYVKKEHEPNKVSHDYYSFMKNIFEGNEYVINTISGGLNDLNIEGNDFLIIQQTVDKIKDILL